MVTSDGQESVLLFFGPRMAEKIPDFLYTELFTAQQQVGRMLPRDETRVAQFLNYERVGRFRFFGRLGRRGQKTPC